jgi:hypothetical protein
MPTDTSHIVNRAWKYVRALRPEFRPLRPELERLRPELPPELYVEPVELGWDDT